jgi:hypothetical protein
MDAIVLEVIAPNGTVQLRRILNVFPCTLGRAPDCDVVIDSPDVSARHARLERGADGALTIEDLGSTNGLSLDGMPLMRIALAARTEVGLGSIRLRFTGPSEKLERTVVFRPSRLGGAKGFALALAAVVVAANFEVLFFPAYRLKPWSHASGVFGIVCACMAWSFVWALGSRVTLGRFMFKGHATATLIAAAALQVVIEPVVDLVGFSVSKDLVPWLASGLLTALAIWLLAQHLARTTLWTVRRRYLSASIVCLLVCGVAQIVMQANREDYSASLPVWGAALPPAFVWGSGTPLPEVVGGLDRLQAEVDALRAKAR